MCHASHIHSGIVSSYVHWSKSDITKVTSNNINESCHSHIGAVSSNVHRWMSPFTKVLSHNLCHTTTPMRHANVHRCVSNVTQVMSHNIMCHVSHTQMCHVSHTQMCHVSHTQMCHVSHTQVPCPAMCADEWVMSYKSCHTSHITQYEWVIAHAHGCRAQPRAPIMEWRVMSHNLKESCHIIRRSHVTQFEGVMSHNSKESCHTIWRSHVT